MPQTENPPSSFVWGAGGARKTPEQVAREREIADALIARGMDFSPVGSWTQGLARVANAAAGAFRGYRADQAEAEGRASADKVTAALLGGDAPAAAPQASGGSDIVPPSASGPDYSPRAVTTVPQQPGGVGMFTNATAPTSAPAADRGSPDPSQLLSYLSDPEKKATLPAGMRNNNPGNIKYLPTLSYAGIVGPSQNTDQGDPQAVFDSPEAGMAAMHSLLAKKYAGGKTTPMAIIAGNGGWTPGNTQAAANVARNAGIGPNDDINFSDPVAAGRFMRALILQEHGNSGNLYPASMISAVAGGGAQTAQAPMGAPAAPVQQVADRGNGRMNQLLTAANNPWLSDGQRMVIGALLKQEMEKNDPGNALELEYKRAQIEALRNKGQPRSWSKLDDNTLYDATTGETKSVRADGEAPMFSGTSVEAQALNGLVKSGELTPEQALQLGAGKTISGPNGEIIFMTPQGVFSRPGANGAVGAPSQAGPVQQNGMIPITDPKVSESQKNAMTYADRMIQSGKLLDDLGTAGTGLWDNIAVGIPVVGNSMVSPDFQKVDQAKRDFINAQLRRESGAAISQSEFDNAERQYFPQRGDSPEVVAQKAANRRTVVEGMRRDAGPTYVAPALPDSGAMPSGGVEFERGPDGKLRRKTQ